MTHSKSRRSGPREPRNPPVEPPEIPVVHVTTIAPATHSVGLNIDFVVSCSCGWRCAEHSREAARVKAWTHRQAADDE